MQIKRKKKEKKEGDFSKVTLAWSLDCRQEELVAATQDWTSDLKSLLGIENGRGKRMVGGQKKKELVLARFG